MDREGMKYYVVLGLIVDSLPTVKQAIGWTLVYQDEDKLVEDWPEAQYLELEEMPEPRGKA